MEVERHLAQYLASLGIERKIARLRSGWTVEEYPALREFANEVLDEIQPTLACIDAIAPREEPSVRAALYLGVGFAITQVNRAGSILVSGYCMGGIEEGELDAALRDLQSPGRIRDALSSIAHLVTNDELAALASMVLRAVQNPHGLPGLRGLLAAREMIGSGHAIDASRTLFVREDTNEVSTRRFLDAWEAREASDAGVAHAMRGALAGRQPVAAREACDALSMRKEPADGESLRRFAAWCIQALERGHGFDLSWIAIHWLETRDPTIKAWSRPIFEAYVAGAWFLYWSRDTLFWVAKPRLYFDGARRLHRADGPAFESDVEDHHFWHGVLVPAFIVTQPERISPDRIRAEGNVEVRRVMIERYGYSRYLLDSKAEVIHQDEFGTLYRARLVGDEALVMVRVVNATSEPDGSLKEHFLRVPPTIRRAREAIAWTFGLEEKEYHPEVET
jgi:hypothetical protein